LENLPDNLRILRLGYCFNQRLDELPPNLYVIKIFNKDLNIDSLHDKYILEVIDNKYDKIINIKGKRGMFTKSSNKF